jgi:hypothetical protein
MKTFFAQRRVKLLLASVVLSLLIVFAFLMPRNPGPYRAVPNQTSLVMAFNGLVKAGQQWQKIPDGVWKEAKNALVFQKCWQEITNAEATFHHNATVRQAFAQNPLLACYTLHPADSLHALFVLKLEEDIDLEAALKASPLQQKHFPYQFRSQVLYTVHLSKSARLVVAQKGKLLLFSNFSYLVEDALSQLDGTSNWWSDNQYLRQLNPEAGIRLFFRPQPWLAQQKSTLHPLARRFATTLAENVSWAGVAWDGTEATAMGCATGFLSKIGTWPGNSQGDLWSVFPNNTTYFNWAGFDDRALFYKQLSHESNADFEHFVQPWLGKQAALVATEPLSDGLADDRLLFFSVSDSARARALLQNYGSTRGSLAADKIGMFDVFGFQSGSLLKPLLGEEEQAFQNPYVVLLGQYAVVGPNRPAVEVYVEQYIANQTLAQQEDFLQAAQVFSGNARCRMALNGGYLPRLLEALWQQPEQAFSSIRRLEKLGWLTAEIVPQGGPVFEIKLAHQPLTTALPTSNTVWKLALGAPAIQQVHVVEQPGLPQGAALLVQDKKTELYCLHPDGSLAWQKRIGHFILSSVYGVDFFQNGRKCYLFNTKSHVWMLDENGKEVQGYPLPLTVAATKGMRIADFDKSVKINYFIPGEHQQVYGFDWLGRALEGWNPQMETGVATGAPKHVQQQGKDYLAVLSTSGNLHVFGRDGKPRIPALQLDGSFQTGLETIKIGGKTHFVCVNTNGMLYTIALDGKTTKQQCPVGTEKGAFLLASAVEETVPGYVAVWQKRQLHLYKASTSGLVRVTSKQLQDAPDDVWLDAAGVGTCARSRRKIQHLDFNGNINPALTLSGSTRYQFFNLGSQRMVATGNGSAVYAYKFE